MKPTRATRKLWADATNTPTASPWHGGRSSLTPGTKRGEVTTSGAVPATPDAWPMDYRFGFPGFPMPMPMGVPGCLPGMPNPMMPGSMVPPPMMTNFGMPIPGLMSPTLNSMPNPMMVHAPEPMSVDSGARGGDQSSTSWPYSFSLEMPGLSAQSSPNVDRGKSTSAPSNGDTTTAQSAARGTKVGVRLRAEISSAERLDDVSKHASQLTLANDEEQSPDMPRTISLPEAAKHHSPTKGKSPTKPSSKDGVESEASDGDPVVQDDGVPEIPAQCPPGLPSRGSTWHATGKCRPCAWFWKPKGCQGYSECRYCHLCPEGELKARKKAKVAAMRMGALAPAEVRKDGSNAAPRVLRLTPLLKS